MKDFKKIYKIFQGLLVSCVVDKTVSKIVIVNVISVIKPLALAVSIDQDRYTSHDFESDVISITINWGSLK